MKKEINNPSEIILSVIYNSAHKMCSEFVNQQNKVDELSEELSAALSILKVYEDELREVADYLQKYDPNQYPEGWHEELGLEVIDHTDENFL